MSRHEFDLIQNWLTCDDCQGGERDSVSAIGDRVTPLLVEAILDYPAERRDNLATQYGRLYHELVGAPIDSVTFVNDGLDSFDRMVRSRAVRSMGDVGAFSELKEVLDSATALGWPTESLAMIRAGLLRDLSGVPIATGAFGSWTVDQPAVAVEVCNGLGPVPCTETWTVQVRARATGPLGTVTPWTQVYFYQMRPTASGSTTDLLAIGGAPVATADAVNTHFDWSLDYGASGIPPGPVQIIAVGVDGSGLEFRTPSLDFVVVVDGT